MKDNEFSLIKDLIPTDLRGRLVLGEPFKNKQYKMLISVDGEIRLVPVVTIPAKEAWLFKNTKAVNALKKGLEQSSSGETVSLGSFIKHSTNKIDD